MTLVRFAPSPTGLLHVGNARTALINWLYAKKVGGDFMLRLDDTDTERSTEEFAKQIEEDLKWLGIDWQKFDKQSDRGDRYTWGFEKLKEAGRLYPCYETTDELSIKRKVQLSRGLPPLYDRSALALTEEEIRKFEDEGRTPHWRFKMDHTPIEWEDLGRGRVSFEGSNIGDPVLFREDMKPIYMLASTVDDMDHGITHVVRGEDHISNTAIMIQICEALGGTSPVFVHLSLLTTLEGEGLSKRKGSLSLEQLRAEGIMPMAINSYLAKIGTSDPIEAKADMQSLIDEFDFTKFSRATPKFDSAELKHLNTRLIHTMPFDQVKDKVSNIDARTWETIRGNIESFDDVAEWTLVIQGPVSPVIEEKDFVEQAANMLPPEPWDQSTWGAWTGDLKEQSGRKGKALFMPLRQALTGMDHGPELDKLLPLVGYDKAMKRLKGEAA